MKIASSAGPCFQGKFVMGDSLSVKNKANIEKFLKFEFDGKTNKRFLMFKPYDILIKQDKENEEKMLLSASFREPFMMENTDCFISTLYSGDEYLESATKALRGSLKWFENFKKSYNGYNNVLERVVSNVKEVFSAI